MKVILFGATGMVGQGVLRECLLDEGVTEVIAVGRKPLRQQHAKLRELTRADLFNGEDLPGYDACFFCLGVSSAGMSEPDYTHLTYDLTMAWALRLARLNPQLVFTYVSGAGTGGKAMWARVKKRTEDDLLALFPQSVMFRLAALQSRHGELPRARWTRVLYTMLSPLVPVVRLIAPGYVATTEELGRAMLRAARGEAPKRVLESRDIRALGGPRDPPRLPAETAR